MIGSKSDYRRSDYMFQREETAASKLLPFEQREPVWKSIAAGLLLVFAITIIIVLT